MLALLRDPIFLFAGLAMAIQSGMEGMSNDWMTRYFKNVTLAGEQRVDERKTQLGLVAVTGALVVTRLRLVRLARLDQLARRALREHRGHCMRRDRC